MGLTTIRELCHLSLARFFGWFITRAKPYSPTQPVITENMQGMEYVPDYSPHFCNTQGIDLVQSVMNRTGRTMR